MKLCLELLPLAILCLFACTAHATADPCEQTEENSTQSLYLDHDGTPLSRAEFSPPHSTMLALDKETKLSCNRVRQQLQSVGWGNATACKGLLDPRPLDARSYFQGPNDPRRCLTTVRIESFKNQMKDFLEAKDIGSDLNGHAFNSGELQKLLKSISSQSGCEKASALADRFNCYSKGFEELAKRLEKAERALNDRKQTVANACGAFQDAGLDANAIALVAQIAQDRHRPANLPAKDYPAFIDCRAHDFPRLLSTCKSPSAEALSDEAWGCLKKGINTIWKTSAFAPPSGVTNIFRDRLAALRARAIELSVLERLCTSDGDAKALLESKPSALSNETQSRCQTAEFEALRKTTDWHGWLASFRKKEKPAAPPQINVANAADCPPNKTAVLSSSATKNIQSTAKAVARASDESVIEISAPESKRAETNHSETEKTVEEKPLDALAVKLKSVIPPLPPASVAAVKAGDPPTPVTANYRSEKELIKAAQDELARWKKKEASDFEFAQFFLETEFSGSKPAASQHYFQKLLGLYLQKKKLYEDAIKRATGSNDDRIEALMQKMNEDFVKDYTSGNALLTNFLQNEGGNCEAEAKIIDSVLKDLKLSPDSGKVVGIQVFDDHVQPVVYDKKTRHVWVLHTGEQYSGLVAPIYHTEILLHGYLDAKSASSPVSEESLLIEGLNTQEKAYAKARDGTGKALRTNTNLKLPKTEIIYSHGPVPKHAKISLQARTQEAKDAKDFKPGHLSAENPVGDPYTTCLADFRKYLSSTARSPKNIEKLIRAETELKENPHRLSVNTDMMYWIFRNCSDRDELDAEIKAQKNRNGYLVRTDFIRELTRKEARALIQSHDFLKFSEFFSDPSLLLTEQGLQDFKAAQEKLTLIEEYWNKKELLAGYIGMPTDEIWKNLILAENPELSTVALQWNSFHKYVREHPAEIMRLRGKFNQAQWNAFRQLTEGALLFYEAYFIAHSAADTELTTQPEQMEKWQATLNNPKETGFQLDFRAPRSGLAERKAVQSKKEIKESHASQAQAQAMEELDDYGVKHGAVSQPTPINQTIHIASTGLDEEEKKPVEKKEEIKPLAAAPAKAGVGTKERGSSQNLPEKAMLELPPADFALLLYEAVASRPRTSIKLTLPRWTPTLTEALLKLDKQTAESPQYLKLRSWFLAQGYREISELHFDKDSPRSYPGPDGPATLDRKLAMLYRQWLEFPISMDLLMDHEVVHFRTAMEKIEKNYGSEVKFKEALQKSLNPSPRKDPTP